MPSFLRFERLKQIVIHIAYLPELFFQVIMESNEPLSVLASNAFHKIVSFQRNRLLHIRRIILCDSATD